MTRVWKAEEISEFGGRSLGKKPVALKDVWLDKGAPTELEIQDKIFKAIQWEKDLHDTGEPSRLQAFPETSALLKVVKASLKSGDFQKYFMTIECDHVGPATKPVPAGAVPAAGLFTQKEEAGRTFSIKGSDPSRACDIVVRPSPNTTAAMQANVFMHTPSPTPTLPSTHPPTTDPTTDHGNPPLRLYQPKNRYYLVFAEVGQALRDVLTLPIFFQALSNVFLGEFITRLHCTTLC